MSELGNIIKYKNKHWHVIQQIFKTINPPDMKNKLHVKQSMTHDNNDAHNSLFDPSTILGHKTIRMLELNSIKFTPKEMSDFLKRNFPCSKVIINIRKNVTLQIKSRVSIGWHKNFNASAVEPQGIHEFHDYMKSLLNV